MIEDIKQYVSDAVSAVDKSSNDVAAGMKNVNEAEVHFLEISDLIKSVQEKVSQVLSQTDTLSNKEASKEINHSMNETAAHTQTVSAATEEQFASMQQIAASSDDLAHAATELKTVLNQFHIYSKCNTEKMIL